MDRCFWCTLVKTSDDNKANWECVKLKKIFHLEVIDHD